MSQKYIVYGSDFSYFTRKLEAAMIFYGADYEQRSKGANNAKDIEQRSGTHQVPVLQTPENWMVADTTPLLHLLDARFPGREMFPTGPLGVLTQIIEDYFDEWVARTMVHYRWHYEESAIFASSRMTNGDEAAAVRIRDWGPRACRATGTESKHQQEQAEAEYMRVMEAMEAQLQTTRYLLGDRPSAVDCVMLGGLRAHTNMDPTPRRAIAKYSRVIDWVEQGADQWDGTGDWLSFPESTPFVQFVLNEMSATYVPYMLENAKALDAGARAFHLDIYDEDVSFLCRPYPEKSRQMIIDRISTLAETKQHNPMSNWLIDKKLDQCFA